MHLTRIFRTPIRRAATAALLALALTSAAPDAMAAGVSPNAATPVQREQAQSRFLRGKELYSGSRFDAALAEFTASLDIVTSPNTRLYVARCQREMNRLVPAYVEFGRAVVEAKELAREDPRYEKAAQAALDERKQLEPKLGFIDISITRAGPTTTLKVSGDEVRRGGWNEPVPVLPGNAEVVVETPGHTPIKRNLSLAPGEKQSLSIDAAADSPEVAVVDTKKSNTTTEEKVDTTSDKSSLRPYAFVAGGIALAGLATFTVFGLMANATYSDLETSCGPRPCPPGHEDDISSGKTQQTVANVGLGVFVIGAAAAVTLYLLSSPKASTAAAKTTRVVARGPYLGLEGTF